MNHNDLKTGEVQLAKEAHQGGLPGGSDPSGMETLKVCSTSLQAWCGALNSVGAD